MIDEKNNYGDDETRISCRSLGNIEAQDEEFVLVTQPTMGDGPAMSVASAPASFERGNDEYGVEGLDSHEYPPFASAVPVNDDDRPGQENDGFPAPVPQEIEVDAEARTIRIAMASTKENTPQNTDNNTSTSQNERSPMSRLNRYQRCWLIVFVRMCARKTGVYSKAAARKYSPKIKDAASRSAVAIKNATARSASFVKSQSTTYKNRAVEFNEKHQVGDKARKSVKKLSREVGKASKATVNGAKKATVVTAQSIQELEEKHHIMRKTKNSVKKGGRMIRNAWNGKPLNYRDNKRKNNSTNRPANVPVHAEPINVNPITNGDNESRLKTAPPSSE